MITLPQRYRSLSGKESISAQEPFNLKLFFHCTIFSANQVQSGVFDGIGETILLSNYPAVLTSTERLHRWLCWSCCALCLAVMHECQLLTLACDSTKQEAVCVCALLSKSICTQLRLVQDDSFFGQFSHSIADENVVVFYC